MTSGTIKKIKVEVADILTHEYVLQILMDHRDKEGSWAALARKIGVTRNFMCDVGKGHRRPGKKVLDYLGLRGVRTVEYSYIRERGGRK